MACITHGSKQQGAKHSRVIDQSLKGSQTTCSEYACHTAAKDGTRSAGQSSKGRACNLCLFSSYGRAATCKDTTHTLLLQVAGRLVCQ
jgi:hypothetical protein